MLLPRVPRSEECFVWRHLVSVAVDENRTEVFLTAGKEWEEHGEDSAHIKRRQSSSLPHNRPSSSGSHCALPAHTGVKHRGGKLEPPSCFRGENTQSSPQKHTGKSRSLITTPWAESGCLSEFSERLTPLKSRLEARAVPCVLTGLEEEG